MKQTEELKRSAFTISVAAESNGMGNVHWRSDEYVTLSGALAVLASYKAELREENIKLKEGIKKFVHHWRIYFDSPKVGQPPVLSDLEALLEDNPTEKLNQKQ